MDEVLRQGMVKLFARLIPAVFAGIRFHLNSLSSQDIRVLRKTIQKAITEGAWFNQKGFRHLRDEFLNVFLRKDELLLCVNDVEALINKQDLYELTKSIDNKSVQTLISFLLGGVLRHAHKKNRAALILEELRSDPNVERLQRELEAYLRNVVRQIKSKPELISNTVLKSQSPPLKWVVNNLINELVDGSIIANLVFSSLEHAYKNFLLDERHFFIVVSTQKLEKINITLSQQEKDELSSLLVNVFPLLLDLLESVINREKVMKEYLLSLSSWLKQKNLALHAPFKTKVMFAIAKSFLTTKRIKEELLEGVNKENMKALMLSSLGALNYQKIEKSVVIFIALFCSYFTGVRQPLNFKNAIQSHAVINEALQNSKEFIVSIINGKNNAFLSFKGKIAQRLMQSQTFEKRLMTDVVTTLFNELEETVLRLYLSDLLPLYRRHKKLNDLIEKSLSTPLKKTSIIIGEIESTLQEIEHLSKEKHIRRELILRNNLASTPQEHYINKEERRVRKNEHDFVQSILSIQEAIKATTAKERVLKISRNLVYFKWLYKELKILEKDLKRLDYAKRDVRLLFSEWWAFTLYLLPSFLIHYLFKETISVRQKEAKEKEERLQKEHAVITVKLEPIAKDPSLLIRQRFFKPEKERSRLDSSTSHYIPLILGNASF